MARRARAADRMLTLGGLGVADSGGGASSLSVTREKIQKNLAKSVSFRGEVLPRSAMKGSAASKGGAPL